MIALYIILGLAAVITLLLFTDIHIRVSIDQKILVKARFLFYKRTLIPKDPKRKTRLLLLNVEKSDKELKGDLRKLIDKMGVLGTVKELISATVSLVKQGWGLAHHLRVKKLDADIIVASDDPSKTAIEYGGVCAVVYPLISGLQNLMKWNNNKTHINISSDFCSNDPSINLEAKLKLKLWYYIKAYVGLYWDLIKKKYDEAMANEMTKRRTAPRQKSTKK